MKQIHKTIELLLRAQYLEGLRLKNKLLKLWPQETTNNGILIFRPQVQLLPGICLAHGHRWTMNYSLWPPAVVKEERYCKSYEYTEPGKTIAEFLEPHLPDGQKFPKKEERGLASYGLYLNPFKATTNFDILSSNLLQNINKASGKGIKATVTCLGDVSFLYDGDTYSFDIIPFPLASNSAEAVSNFRTHFSDREVQLTINNALENTGEEVYKQLGLIVFLLYSSGAHIISNIRRVDVRYSKSFDYTVTDSEGYDSTLTRTYRGTVPSVSFDIEIPEGYTTISAAVTSLIKEKGINSSLLRKLIFKFSNGIEDSEEDIYLPSGVVGGTLSNHWVVVGHKVGGIGTLYGLKPSIFNDPNVKTREAVQYVYSCIDTYYTEVKLSKAEKVVRAVYLVGIVIVAVILAIPSGGWSLVAAATFITTLAFYLTIIAYALGRLGEFQGSIMLSNFLKEVDPLVQVASVVAFFGGIQNMLKAGMYTSAALKIVQLSFDLYAKNQLEKDSKKLQNARKLEQDSAQQLEDLRTNHVLLNLARVLLDPLDVEMSQYAALYDLPYEKWATPYHTGNAQRTTVSAFWTTDKKNMV